MGLDKAELLADEQALTRLEALRRVRELLAETSSSIEMLEVRLAGVRDQQAALESLAEAPPGSSDADAELDALLKGIENLPPLDELSAVEQYAREKELEALIDEEL